MLHNVLLKGEVSGASVRGNGVWFTLRDQEASIACVCWEKARCPIKDGDQVTVRGSVDFWNKAGKINFTVYALVQSGDGELLKQLQELMQKLKAEGLFERKKALPAKVKRIGVVSSRYGAVIHRGHCTVSGGGAGRKRCAGNLRRAGLF